MNFNDIENYVETTESLSNYLYELSEVYDEVNNISGESFNSKVLEEKFVNILSIYNNARGVIGLKPEIISHEAFNRSPYMSLAVTREGIFSSIGEFFKKIWEWIKKIFKAIKEFFFGTSEEKAEEAKEEAEDVKKLLEKLRNRDLRDREFILKDLEKDNLLIRDGDKYGILGIMFKRAEYNISYKAVADDIRSFLEDMEGFFKLLDKENINIINDKDVIEFKFGAAIAKVANFAYNVNVNYNNKLKKFKLYEKFGKFQDCLDIDFKNDPVIGEIEKGVYIARDEDPIVLGKNVRCHLTYLNERVAWKMYTMDDTNHYNEFIKSSNAFLENDAAVSKMAAGFDSGAKNLSEPGMKRLSGLLKYSDRSLIVPVTGYKLKDKEIDALKSYVTNKDNILNFLKIYSDFLNTIDVNAYKEVGNRIDKISNEVDKTMNLILKKHNDKEGGWLTFTETGKNHKASYSFLKDLASVIRTKVADLSRFALLLGKEVSIFSSELKFETIANIITPLFKEGSGEGEVSSESYIKTNIAPKLSFGTSKNIEPEVNKGEEEDIKKKFISGESLSFRDMLLQENYLFPEPSLENVPQQPQAQPQQQVQNQQPQQNQNAGMINNITNELKSLMELFNNVINNMKSRLVSKENAFSIENSTVTQNKNSKDENITKVFNEVANNFNSKLRDINKNFLAISKYNTDVLKPESLTNFSNKIRNLKNDLTNINNNINSIPKAKAYSQEDKNLVHNIANRIKNVEESILKDPVIKELESKSAEAHMGKKVEGNPYQLALKIADDLIVRFYESAINRIVKEAPNTYPTDDKVYEILHEEYEKIIDVLRKIVSTHRNYSGEKEGSWNPNDFTGLVGTYNENRALANSLESAGWQKIDKFLKEFVKFFDTKESTDRTKLKSVALSIINKINGNKPVDRQSYSDGEIEEKKVEVKKISIDLSKLLR